MFAPRSRHVWVRRPFGRPDQACQGLVHHWAEDGASAFVTWVDEQGRAINENVEADRLIVVKAQPNIGSAYG